MLKNGMIIAERYEILGKIGNGGMADVYKAMDHKLNRFVAVKVLKPEFREDTTFIRKFRSEAQAAAGLTHPNIVNVYDVGDDEGVYYIVMELIEGITLKEYITKKGRLTIKEATSIAIQVSMGLEAAHNHGIVHRDVKPQNIIISTDGKVKVTDFGIARAASSNTISSNVMGSVHYSSPEQVRGGYSDEKSDIYSLGITLYEMVTGRVPFDGDTTVAIAIKHLQEEMVLPSVYAQDLPYSLEQIIVKCTQKSVGRRYSRMEDVISDLKHSLIDPQGDFVTLNKLDNEAKTRVFSQEEIGEIKSSKQGTYNGSRDGQPLQENEYEGEEEGGEGRRESTAGHRRKSHGTGKSRAIRRLFKILGFIIGTAVVVMLIIFLVKKTGIINILTGQDQIEADASPAPSNPDSDKVEVPNLVGCTEAEAKEMAKAVSLGTQMVGEVASSYPAGTIAQQETPAGSMIEPFTTLKYYTSKGSTEVTVPFVEDSDFISATQTLENKGFTVTISKEYVASDDGYPLVDVGHVVRTEPASGSSLQTGDNVVLVVSRGVDYGGSTFTSPSVVGESEDNARIMLSKFADIQVVYEASDSVEAGRVVSQSPAGGEEADPDGTVILTVSSGASGESVAEPEETMVEAESEMTPAESTGSTGMASIDPVSGSWVCGNRLNTPKGYNGGAVRLELVQTVNDQPVSTLILEGEVLSFPYKLNIIGADGVADGLLYFYELQNGVYQSLGHYPITFEQVP